MKLIHSKAVRMRWLAVPLLGALAFLAVPTTAEASVASCSSSTPVSLRPVLYYGRTGSCVKVAQAELNSFGQHLIVDGAFGPKTLAATRSFQSSHHLVVDGVIGPHTWAALAGGKATSTSSTPAPAPVPSGYNRGSGPNYTSRVVLTFDDCPPSLSAMKTVARYARSANIGLVMFPTGNCISAGKFSASYARAYGQYVGNHSISHPLLTTLSYSSVLRQLGAPGVVTNYGRPPYGATNATVNRAYAAKGMREWTWNLDTNDWRGYSQSYVVNYVTRYAQPGQTVLMHMSWHAFNPTAISQIKAGLAKRGIAVCRAHAGTTPVNFTNRLPC